MADALYRKDEEKQKVSLVLMSVPFVKLVEEIKKGTTRTQVYKN